MFCLFPLLTCSCTRESVKIGGEGGRRSIDMFPPKSNVKCLERQVGIGKCLLLFVKLKHFEYNSYFMCYKLGATILCETLRVHLDLGHCDFLSILRLIVCLVDYCDLRNVH